MTRLGPLDRDDVPPDAHHPLTDDYLGGRPVGRVRAPNPGILEATPASPDTRFGERTPRRPEPVGRRVARTRNAAVFE